MARTTINISLPESMRDYVAFRADEGYGSVSDYVRELIRNDQKKYVEELDVVVKRQNRQPQQAPSAGKGIPVTADGYLDVCELLRN